MNNLIHNKPTLLKTVKTCQLNKRLLSLMGVVQWQWKEHVVMEICFWAYLHPWRAHIKIAIFICLYTWST